jgi:hypothetical protein
MSRMGVTCALFELILHEEVLAAPYLASVICQTWNPFASNPSASLKCYHRSRDFRSRPVDSFDKHRSNAGVAELVDAPDLGSGA